MCVYCCVLWVWCFIDTGCLRSIASFVTKQYSGPQRFWIILVKYFLGWLCGVTSSMNVCLGSDLICIFRRPFFFAIRALSTFMVKLDGRFGAVTDRNIDGSRITCRGCSRWEAWNRDTRWAIWVVTDSRCGCSCNGPSTSNMANGDTLSSTNAPSSPGKQLCLPLATPPTDSHWRLGEVFLLSTG